MRITGGIARGIQLKAPKGAHTRPATDRFRETIFSSISSNIKDALCIDLFAGTGSYGLEALSRGAKYCLFIENNPQAISCLKSNQEAVAKSAQLVPNAMQLSRLNLMQDSADLRRETSLQETLKADFIFLDPPYELLKTKASYILDQLADRFANPKTKLILELPSDLIIQSTQWNEFKRIGASGRCKPSVAFFERIN